MKACFIASIKGKTGRETEYKEIVSVLQNCGIKVYSDHVLGNTQEDIDRMNQEERVKFHKKIMDQIKKTDLVVAEITSQSISVGFLISMAIELKKPTVLLYKGSNEPNLLSTLEKSEELIVGRYSGVGDIKSVLSKLIDDAKDKSDVRFNFFVSPQILSYLDWVAKEKRIPRSVFLRDLIEKQMKRDKAFKG